MRTWKNCPAIERDPERVSGAWLFRSTRVPVASLFENLKDGATVDQFLDWFPGVERWQVQTVLYQDTRDVKFQWIHERPVRSRWDRPRRTEDSPHRSC